MDVCVFWHARGLLDNQADIRQRVQERAKSRLLLGNQHASRAMGGSSSQLATIHSGPQSGETAEEEAATLSPRSLSGSSTTAPTSALRVLSLKGLYNSQKEYPVLCRRPGCNSGIQRMCLFALLTTQEHVQSYIMKQAVATFDMPSHAGYQGLAPQAAGGPRQAHGRLVLR